MAMASGAESGSKKKRISYPNRPDVRAGLKDLMWRELRESIPNDEASTVEACCKFVRRQLPKQFAAFSDTELKKHVEVRRKKILGGRCS